VERADTAHMRGYGQFCPIARASEILAERWTPIIVRNVLLGSRTFNQIADGAPGISRALLTRRLRELEKAGLIQAHRKPAGHGSFYEPTPAGLDLQPVLDAVGVWAERWVDVRPDHAQHADPGHVVASWCTSYLRRDRLPRRRVVARFDYARRGRREQCWLLCEDGDAEACVFDPGYGDDLVVAITDPKAFTGWHLGLISWPAALRGGGVQVTGPTSLRRALPTWNAAPEHYTHLRTAQRSIGAATS
ncbi:helix-turn-helix domain-containing protein, partial [Actinoplanes sp. NPDC051633]|uniref:winged helix-turn-helix transcriptional regulator n=1 Tax=Actinoplanes sp. NPDC051633 TaxID=3155670 RepID=UPI0034426645